MQYVWVMTYDIDYDGSQVVGVYATAERGMETKDLEWKSSGPDEFYCDDSTISCFTLTKTEVIQ